MDRASTNMILYEYMIYHMKVHIVNYNLDPEKKIKILNSYFAYLWTNGLQNGYSVANTTEVPIFYKLFLTQSGRFRKYSF